MIQMSTVLASVLDVFVTRRYISLHLDVTQSQSMQLWTTCQYNSPDGIEAQLESFEDKTVADTSF